MMKSGMRPQTVAGPQRRSQQRSMPEITLIRHAESESNAAGIWNGRHDGDLSERGLSTLDLLGRRLSKKTYDIVISSPLRRALATARSFSDDVEVDAAFTELDLGQWEGKSRDQVRASDADYLEQAISGGNLPMGHTGESLRDVSRRAIAAIEDLARRVGEGGKAAVVTHGGFLQAVLNRHLDGRGRRVHAFVANTSIQRLVWSYERPRLAVFNDTAHLGPRSAAVLEHLDRGDPVMALIRHGQTRANIEGRWQGQSDWGLDDTGIRQAEALADWYGHFQLVYTSPVGRAHSTAKHLADSDPRVVDGLKEINMGLWEGLTSDEIYDKWPDLMPTIYRDGVDLRRGEVGESWGELASRFRHTVTRLSPAPDGPTVVVSHGGAIRSFVSSLTKTTDTHSESLYTPSNTSLTHVAMTGKGPVLLDYSVAAHIEGLSDGSRRG
jgi:broad specificity phosphatase PhoE